MPGEDDAVPVDREPRLVLDAYLLRSLAVAGYARALEECARCGSPGGPAAAAAAGPGGGIPLTAFAVAAGGMVCQSCRPPARPRQARRRSPS